MNLTAKDAAIAHLSAEVDRLTIENAQFRAMQAVVDAIAARRQQVVA